MAASQPAGAASQPASSAEPVVVDAETETSSAQPAESGLSFRRDILPWMTTAAGGAFLAVGLGLVVVGLVPALLGLRAQNELGLLLGTPAPADPELTRSLQAEVEAQNAAWQLWGAPLLAGGLAVGIGGLFMASGGAYLGITYQLGE